MPAANGGTLANGFQAALASLDAVPEDDARVLLTRLAREARVVSTLATTESSAWFDERIDSLLRLQAAVALDQQIDLLFIFVHWYVSCGDWPRSLQATDKTIRLSKQARRPAMLRRALNLRGVALSKVGDFEQSMQCFVESLRISEEQGDRTGWCSTVNNLADGRFNAGLLEESVALNEHVIELATGDPMMHTTVAISHHNAAIALMRLSDFAGALSHMERATALRPRPSDAIHLHDEVILEATYTRLLVALGRLDEARHHAQASKRYADRLATRRAYIMAELAESLCDVVSGYAGPGLQRLERLKEEARGNEPVLRDIMEAEILGYRTIGREEDAKRCQEQYLFHLAQWQVEYAAKEIAALQQSIRDGTKAATPGAEKNNVPAKKRSAASRPASARNCLDRLESLATFAELREDSSGEHAPRVGRLAALLARRLGHDARHAAVVERAARLHDLGKLSVPDVVLNKRHKLDRLERDILRRHATEGAGMIARILDSLQSRRGEAANGTGDTLRLAAEIARNHHEWWDGTGYPSELSGAAIPAVARIVAICDLFDELVHGRVYRKARSVSEALDEIASRAGKQFDPAMCGEFRSLVDELRKEHGEELERFGTRAGPVSPFMAANQVIARIVRSAAKASDTGYSFTAAEREVLKWLKLGRSNREIAKILYKSEFTVKTHIQHMLSKTGLDNRVQLASLSLRSSEQA